MVLCVIPMVQFSPFITLCLGSIGMDCVISEWCYDGIVLQKNFRIMTILWSLSCNSFVKFQRGPGFEPHPRHCVVSAGHIYPCLLLVQPRKTCPNITERLLTGT